jgi:hypothetical protein
MARKTRSDKGKKRGTNKNTDKKNTNKDNNKTAKRSSVLGVRG